jgi:hypothetical protein
MRQDTFSLAEGDAVLRWPTPISAESLREIKDWLQSAERRISRSVQITEPKNYMEEKIAAGECIDIGTAGTKLRPGVFRLQEFKEDGADYCDLAGKDWLRSIGKHKQTGEILASTGTEYYSNPDYECIFLR